MGLEEALSSLIGAVNMCVYYYVRANKMFESEFRCMSFVGVTITFAAKGYGENDCIYL